MDGREAQHQQYLKFCHFLYTFCMKFFPRKTLTAVALSSFTSKDCTELPVLDSSPPHISSPTHQIDPAATLELINGWSFSSADHRSGENESSPAENKGAPVAWIANDGFAREEQEEGKAPKKMVSINENVGDINSILKQRRESKSKKADSLGHPQEQDHQPKRLRSILRVGSALNETSHSILS